jgi:hypothetical protein
LTAAWGAAWPLALAAVIAVMAVRLRRAGRLPAMPGVPPGDLGIPLERGAAALSRSLVRFANESLPRALGILAGVAGAVIGSGPGWSVRLGHVEARITAWSVTGALVLLLAAVFAWLMA